MSESERLPEEQTPELKDDASGSSSTSYASPKDHISVSSGVSDQQNYVPTVNTEGDAPTVERLKRTEPSENEEAPSEPEPERKQSLVSSDDDEVIERTDEEIVFGENDEETDQTEPDVVEEPPVEDELSYEHRPKESTPTRKSLSQAARELATEGIPKMDKRLARSLSGLTAEVLGDEGRANSPLDDESWRRQEKHFFILSSAGKPIFSRHGDEGSLCGMMAILEAIHSVVHHKGEEPLCITDGPVKIVFLSKGPVALVAVSRRREAVKWIVQQLDYLYNHVLCLATGALLKVLKQNPGHDIRNLLKGSHQVTERLIIDFGQNPGLFLRSLFPVRMLSGIRQNAISALTEAAKMCQARASFLLFDGQVVCMTQEAGNQLEVVDLLLLLNFVLSNELYRSQSAAEFNAPVCMPHLHETAFLHAYIYFIDKDPDLVVVLLMTQPDTFHTASEARKAMEKRLRDVGVVHSLRSKKTGARIFNKGQVVMEELPLAAGGGRRDLSAVQTFLFNRRSTLCPQYILCQPSILLNTETAWKNMMDTLASIHLELPGGKKTTTQKIHWYMDSHHSILYESSSDWEMYLVCDPLTLKEHASSIGKQIVRFLLSEQVKEELFLPTGEK